MINLQRINSSDPDFRRLIIALDEDLWSRYNELQAQYDGFNRIDRIDTVVIARLGTTAVGCACFKHFDATTIEIKRMFVEPGHRGLGIATAILAELERWAAQLGYRRAILETGNKQEEAVGLYGKLGYTLIENFEPYTQMSESICLAKPL